MRPAPSSPDPSLLTSVMRIVRRAAPARLRGGLRRWMFEWLDLTWTTSSGIRIRLAEYMDWVIYNEIFVSGEYDAALALALERQGTRAAPFQVFDIGAHAGFFTLRVVDTIRRQERPRRFAITAIEANAARVRDYTARVIEENRLGESVRLLPGFVGARQGAGDYVADAAEAQLGRRPERLPYVDVLAAAAGVDRIDLLKCDIEGSELALIEHYPDLFARVDVAVFELHADRCDVERCKQLLASYGFAHHATFRSGHPYSTYAVWR